MLEINPSSFLFFCFIIARYKLIPSYFQYSRRKKTSCIESERTIRLVFLIFSLCFFFIFVCRGVYVLVEYFSCFFPCFIHALLTPPAKKNRGRNYLLFCFYFVFLIHEIIWLYLCCDFEFVIISSRLREVVLLIFELPDCVLTLYSWKCGKI